MAHKKYANFDWQPLIKDYQNGMSLMNLQKKYKGPSAVTIKTYLRRQGVQIFSNRRRDQWGEKNHAFKDGKSRSTISRITKAIVTAKNISLTVCERCGKDYGTPLNRHHKDRDRSNNTKENIENICEACHATEHLSERSRDKRTGRWV